MKVLIVTKDIGGFNCAHPVAEVLKGRGAEVVVTAEGLSLAKWREKKWSVFGGVPETWADPKLLTRNDLEPRKVLEEVRPDVVLTTMGAPINLEESFGLFANKLGIPVVILNDIWGVNTRAVGVKPDAVCVLDKQDASMAESFYTGSGKGPLIVPTGSPAMDTLLGEIKNVVVPRGLERIRKAFSRIIYVMGQDEVTDAYLRGVGQALDHDDDACVIIGLHPKFLAKPEYCTPWLAMVRQIEVPAFWVTAVASSRQYMMISDVVVAGYSTGLIEAPWFRAIPVSWTSEACRTNMARNLGGLTTFPTVPSACVEVGASPTTRDPVVEFQKVLALDFVSREAWVVGAQHELRRNLGMDGNSAERVADVITQVVGAHTV